MFDLPIPASQERHCRRTPLEAQLRASASNPTYNCVFSETVQAWVFFMCVGFHCIPLANMSGSDSIALRSRRFERLSAFRHLQLFPDQRQAKMLEQTKHIRFEKVGGRFSKVDWSLLEIDVLVQRLEGKVPL